MEEGFLWKGSAGLEQIFLRDFFTSAFLKVFLTRLTEQQHDRLDLVEGSLTSSGRSAWISSRDSS